MGPERFELRTSGLGCQVSTITFLTSIVTIFATIFGLIVLYGLVKIAKWIVIAFKGRKGGWVVYEDGSGEIWVRKGPSWGRWWRKLIGKPNEGEDLALDDGIEERSNWAFWRLFSRERNIRLEEEEERRPLFSS